MWLQVVMLLGCQEPFGADRHDLLGFRIAAVTAETTDTEVRPVAAVVVDGHLWSSQPVELEWSFIDAAGDANLEPEAEGIGPRPRLQRRTDRLALHAFTATESAWAELDLTDRQTLDVSLRTELVDTSVEGAQLDDLSRAARREWARTDGLQVAPSGVLRVTASGGEGLARFMGTGDGTFLELETHQADWAAAEVTIDEEDVFTDPIGTGTYSLLVAVIEDHRSGFAVQDVHVSAPTRGVMVNGRWLPTDRPVHGRVWANLFPSDSATAGVRLMHVMPAEPNATWEPESVGCSGVTGPFDPNWLLTGACARDRIVGSRVLIEVDP